MKVQTGRNNFWQDQAH